MDYCNHKLSTKHFEDKTSLILCEYCKRTEDEIRLSADLAKCRAFIKHLEDECNCTDDYSEALWKWKEAKAEGADQ